MPLLSLSLLSFAPSSQNTRVNGFEVPTDEQPHRFRNLPSLTAAEQEDMIRAAYRQIFGEHQHLESHRQIQLESQLRHGQISMQTFILGLATSDPFRRLNYEPNSNTRFVELCIQRILGRPVYGEQEKIAWSIQLATTGLPGFIEQLIQSDEYQTVFGPDTVPFQRRRILPQREQGDILFSRQTPRYDAYYRDRYTTPQRPLYLWRWQYPPYSKTYERVSKFVGIAVLAGAGLLALLVILAFYGIISL